MIKIMIDFFLFILYYRTKRFARAMACCDSSIWGRAEFEHYALYRMGMYRTVSQKEPIKKSWRSLFAVIVSCAACGDRSTVDILLQDVQVLKVLQPKIFAFANALLPFYPDLTAKLLSSSAPSGLLVATWLRLGDKCKAQDCLQLAMRNEKYEPELHLLHSNIFQPSAEVQLSNLNIFLQKYHLAPLALKNPFYPPGAMNLKSQEVLEKVDGPLVSILMTTFRGAERISLAIESLISQTYRNLEIIVVDDASDDDTRSIVEDMMEKDDRIRYFRLPVNVGTYIAKTIALHLSQGEFVTCHDSDDWAHPEKIAKQMAPLLSYESVIFTTSNLIRVQDDGVFYARSVFPLSRINSSSVLFRKKIVSEKTGFWDFVRTGADSEFFARLKIVFGTHAMRKINLPLSFCAHRKNSLMTSASMGYGKFGVSESRLEYWENFSRWHIDALNGGGVPKISRNIFLSRDFPAPEEIRVPEADVFMCMKAFDVKIS